MGDEPGRRIDEATLRHLAGILARQNEIAATSLFPAAKQESLVVTLEDRYYPPSIDAVRLEIRLYTNGAFHVSYFETHLGEIRQRRWDRHEQDHNARDHVHPLPVASTAAARDREFPDTLIGTLETVVLPWVEDRIGTLWDEFA